MKNIERLQKMHELIIQTKTGTPNEFASKLNIRSSQLYNILEEMKSKGFPIVYSRILRSYTYNEACELRVKYSVELLKGPEIIKIIGGFEKKMLYSDVIGLNETILVASNKKIDQFKF